MAFRFAWDDFSESFIRQAESLLTTALNKGKKPAVIADRIVVEELNMGTQVSTGKRPH